VRFRTKLFLAILLPSVLLVAAAVALALGKIRRDSEASVRAAFELAGESIARILSDAQTRLKREELFKAVRLRAIVKEAYDTKEYDRLRKDVQSELETRQSALDYVALVRETDELWFRFAKGTPDPKKEIGWAADREESLFEVGQSLVLARAKPLENEGGIIVLGLDLYGPLDRVRKALNLDLAITEGARLLYRTRSDWPLERMLEGEVTIGEERFLGSRKAVGDLGDLALLRSMKEADDNRRRTLSVGAAGMMAAVLIAGLVSALIARGTSRPIEKLVEATKKVAAGDYATTSGVAGRDEIGRLGEAFDEMTEGLRKRRDIMEKTLSRDVAEELMKGTELGGERREVTIVFMDIRGFTSGTQGVDPADVVTMLNDMMNHLTAVIDRHGGNVNKYLGDGLMAMFGAPKPLEDHALRAARAGLEMQRELAAWNARRVEKRLPSFHSGIGINTGQAVCGRVGSKDRLEYTLIGEEVNLASRICGKAEPRQVLATHATVARFRGELKVRPLEPVQVKGISYPVKVYEVLA
jgi:class 3 adenylate cyclase